MSRVFENERNLWLENSELLSVISSLGMPNCEKTFLHMLITVSDWGVFKFSTAHFVRGWSGILGLIGASLGWQFLYVRQVRHFEIISSNSLFTSGKNNASQALFSHFPIPHCPSCYMDFILHGTTNSLILEKWSFTVRYVTKMS